MIRENELMLGDIFEIELRDRVAQVKIIKVGNKQDADILLDGKEGVCLINSLIPLKLTDNMLIDYKFERRRIKTRNEEINDFFKLISDEYYISLVKSGEKYNLSVKSVSGEKICDSYNIEYLHTLQNIVRSNIKLEIIY